MALPDPISRKDQYLSNIAGEGTEIPSYPITRAEQYLAKIAGQSVETPDYPVSREEQYLAHIAEHGGGGVEVEPLSVTENGTYTAPTGKAYSPVEVNVSGGGGTTATEHGVRFIDYDGSIVTAWDASEVASKTALPDNPTHDRLVAQGWNWDLQHIKDYVANYPNALVTVGQMYKTASRLTEIDITVTKATGLSVTCRMSGNKDWGDGTTDSLTSHTYTDYGDYTITCDGTSIPSGTSTSGGMFGQSGSNMNRYWCTAMYIGENVTSVGKYALRICYNLEIITIPQSVTSFGEYGFNSDNRLKSVIFPQGLLSIDANMFNNTFGNFPLSIPPSVTSIEKYALSYLYGRVDSITIPQGVTTISANLFQYCSSITKFIIPNSVTSIDVNGFNSCTNVSIYDFSSATSVPTLSNTNAFDGINSICKIFVPDTLYNDWIVATNWATYANYIYKASEVAA